MINSKQNFLRALRSTLLIVFKNTLAVGVVALAFTVLGTALSVYGKASSAEESATQIENSQSAISKVSIEAYKHNIKECKKIDSLKKFDYLVSVHRRMPFLLFFGFKECPYCRNFSKTLRNYTTSKHALRVYYIDTDTFGLATQRKSALFFRVRNYIVNRVRLKTTPTVVGVKKGKISGAVRSSLTTFSQLKKLANITRVS